MKALFVGGAVRALATTWRMRVEGSSHLRAAREAGPVLFAPWHEAIIPLVWHHRGQGITLLVGGHRDAELLASTAARWGYGLARGSSTRGGAAGYRGLLDALATGRDAAVTPDGPRGPRHVVKPGLVRAAQRAGASVIPVAARAAWSWRLRSWDRMLVPGPGSLVTIRYGTPLRVAPGRSASRMAVHSLQAALEGLQTR